jgi:hypothetical protein
MTTIWYQIVIQDETDLSGSALKRLVRIIAEILPVHFVVICDAEGAGPNFTSVFPPGQIVELELGKFTSVVMEVVQFDWGDFFLMLRDGQLNSCAPPYADMLPRALATIRAVDDTYFYVYTSDMKTADELCRAYPAAQRQAGKFSDLDFPY